MIIEKDKPETSEAANQVTEPFPGLQDDKLNGQNRPKKKTKFMTSALTTELRARNREMSIYGARSASGLAILIAFTIFGVVLFFWHPSVSWINDLLIFYVVTSCFLTAYSVYNIVMFEAVNKAALPLFESLTNHLERWERVRTSNKNGKQASEPLPLGMTKLEWDLVAPTSRLHVELALREHFWMRQMPFVNSLSQSKTYFRLTLVFGLCSIVLPAILLVVWGSTR